MKYDKAEGLILKTSNFFIERNIKNAKHGRILSICVVIFELIFLAIAISTKSSGSFQNFNYDFYISMYLILIAVSLGYYFLLKRYESEEKSKSYHNGYYYITVVFGFLFILWGMLVSFADQGLYSNLNALFINLIAVASFVYIAPRESTLVFLSQAIIFYIFIPMYQSDLNILIGHYINSTVIFFFTWLTSILSYSVFSSDYLNRNKLQKQLSVNHEINEQLQDVVDKLEALVIEDSLTGLSNRRGLEKFLKNVESVYKSEKVLISFIMIDIDYFKQYNDHYSHIMGDETIKKIGDTLKAHVTSLNDYIIRFGGEEFLFVNVSKSKEEMIKISEKMRKDIEDLKIDHKYSNCSKYATISLGLVTTTFGDKEWLNAQIERADKALYEAKRMGRNSIYAMDQHETM